MVDKVVCSCSFGKEYIQLSTLWYSKRNDNKKQTTQQLDVNGDSEI